MTEKNRNAPPINPVINLDLPEPAVHKLDNGIPLFALDFPGQEILKIEVVFKAGRSCEVKRLTSRTTARLIREGTSRKKSAEIAEFFDFYGASVSIPSNLDTANIILYTLSRYASEVIPVFAEIIRDPVFPEEELVTYQRTGIQELAVELEKVETVAYRKVTELIFGENHPYGYNSVEADYQALQRTDLQAFYHNWYHPDNCFIVASGCVDDKIIAALNKHLGKDWSAVADKPDQPAISHTDTSGKPAKMHISHPGSLQTAIKIGRRAFGRNHPDYDGLYVLNTILGGYFGSRLMTSIREKKGFTYNIYSTLDAYLNDGCLYIATEVNTENTASAVRAILAEMKKLREKPVQMEELSMVRNYLLGMLLNGLDGPLNVSDVVRGLLAEGLPLSVFSRLVSKINSITPEEIQSLALRYLNPEDYWIVTVGQDASPPRKIQRKNAQIV